MSCHCEILFRPALASLAGLLAIVISNSVPLSAATTLPLEGRASTTYDPNTELEWLNLDETAGQSYESVLAGWNGYTTVHGYRYATKEEIVTLFIHAGAVDISDIFTFEPSQMNQANVPGARSLLELLGATYVISDLVRSRMLYDPASEPSVASPDEIPLAFFGVVSFDGEEAAFTLPAGMIAKDGIFPDIASALVRSIPEPSGAAMVLIAPCLVLLRRARR